MELARLVAEYGELPPSAQIEALARLAYEVTVIGRDAYDGTTLGLRHPERMRSLNEMQHRIASQLLALLSADSARYPDDVFTSILLEHHDLDLRGQIAAAFASAVRHAEAACP